MLSFLRDRLSQFDTKPSHLGTTTLSPEQDQSATPPISEHSVLRWVVMLLSHFLSSVTTPSSQCNLFTPLPTNPPSASTSDAKTATATTTTAVEAPPTTATGSEEPKDKEESKHTLMEMHKEVKKMLGYAHTVVGAATNDTDKLAVKQHLESKLKVQYQSPLQL